MSSSAEHSQSFDSTVVNTTLAITPVRRLSAVYTPPILKLPTELLGIIFTHCNETGDFPDTRPNIRLVCKDFEPVVARMLAQGWSGCLDLRVNKHNMDGLAQIRPIFASRLKAIRLYCSDGRLDRGRTEDLTEELRWARELTKENLALCNQDTTSHNVEAEEQQECIMTGAPMESLLQALQTLMSCHNNSVILGTYDLDSSSDKIAEMGLRGVCMKTAHIVDDASSTLQILGSAVCMSGYPVKAIDIRLFDGNLKPCNIEPRDVFWAQLSSFTELTVQQLLSYSKEYLFPSPIKSRISVIQSDGWHLEMGDHCFLPDGNNWICFCSSSFDRANYGALYDQIRSKDFKSVVLEGIEGSVNFLKSDLNLRTDSLERLELLSVFVGETQINTAMQAPSLKFLTYLQSLRRLQTLILEEVEDLFISSFPYHIQRERVEWNGYAEIQQGLKDLIAKAEAHYS